MSIHAFKLMTQGQRLPKGYELLGWIDKHPTNKRHSMGMGVLQSSAGVTVAWDGQAIVSLPNNWRSKVNFVEVGSADDKPTISNQIRQAIKASGQTQVQIADGSGVSQRTISDFVRGGNLTSASLDAIADHLGITAKVPRKLRGETA